MTVAPPSVLTGPPASGAAPGASDAPEREALAGLVERVTFHNPETGFCVLRVKVRGQRDLVTVVGAAAAISAGEFVQATGTWVNDRTHGLQFKAAFLRSAPPTTLEGIERYLGSGMIKGIGPIYASSWSQAFGEAVFDVIEQQPERLREVAGIGPKRARRIVKGWAEQKVIREIMLFLHAHGVGTSRAVRIFKTYGADAVQVISENPYRLARDIRGIGFRTADQIAAARDREDGADPRPGRYLLRPGRGHGRGPLRPAPAELRALAAELLEVPAGGGRGSAGLELEAGEVVADTVDGRACVFLAGLHRAERGIAERLRRWPTARRPGRGSTPRRRCPGSSRRRGSPWPRASARRWAWRLRSKVLVITGGPGVGKTTLVNSIIKILVAKGVKVALAAPTGRAAKRLPRAPGWRPRPSIGCWRRTRRPAVQAGRGEPAGVRPAGRGRDDHARRAADARAAPGRSARAALLLVGDVDQLPSVGPGQVLGDMIESGACRWSA